MVLNTHSPDGRECLSRIAVRSIPCPLRVRLFLNGVEPGRRHPLAEASHFRPNSGVLFGSDPLEAQFFAVKGDVDLIFPQGIAFFEKGRSLESLLDFNSRY